MKESCMKKRDVNAQFACAWVADDRQILVYIWEDEEEKLYLQLMSQDPTLRLTYRLDFKSNMEAWGAFTDIRTSRGDARKMVENVFESMFEKAGKDYENEPGNEDEVLH